MVKNVLLQSPSKILVHEARFQGPAHTRTGISSTNLVGVSRNILALPGWESAFLELTLQYSRDAPVAAVPLRAGFIGYAFTR